MTFVDSRQSAYSSYAIVPPPRTPVGPSMLMSSSKARNSLDNWHKAEDRAGVTYYWNTNGNGSSTSPAHKKQPFSTEKKTPGRDKRLVPPFPISATISIPEMSPSPRIHQSVPIMPRARLLHSRSTPGVSQNGVTSSWVNVSHSSSTTVSNGKDSWYEVHPPSDIAQPPNNKTYEAARVVPTNITPFSSSSEKKRSGRRKPRWGRCMQTLLCCVTAPREIEKPSNGRDLATAASVANATASPITQVHRDGSVSGLPNGSPPAAQNIYVNGTTVDQPSPAIPPPILAGGERSLLAPLRPADSKKKCLIIDLDETLVHSSFKPVKNPDFVIPVEIDGIEHQVYVLKRPYVDEFLAKVGEKFECVLFTASLAKYADPVANLLDKRGVFRARLFREACAYHKGNYVKDLSRLGRDLNKVLIIDNSPASYAFHPENAIPVQTWFDDPTDSELLEILPMLEHIDKFESVYEALRHEDSPTSDPLLNHSSF
ncbi:unnamed protein product [Caenorhabditis auriculariae]|uniref:protein-serine/threonine phosphatase n=1 Tax=Caenorhabditis auriculariae TaxID=2777116 RepID=A0A8S1GMU9_9PELO|nr:unnamed protein product [Caenorhabditis auriculariae]